jgi:hypothetical protein
LKRTTIIGVMAEKILQTLIYGQEEGDKVYLGNRKEEGYELYAGTWQPWCRFPRFHLRPYNTHNHNNPIATSFSG